MSATAYHLEDISNMLDPKTNERSNEAKRLLHITLKQQVESLASRRCVAFSRLSQTMATMNGDHFDAHTPTSKGKQQ
jgi:hypothetical protein